MRTQNNLEAQGRTSLIAAWDHESPVQTQSKPSKKPSKTESKSDTNPVKPWENPGQYRDRCEIFFFKCNKIFFAKHRQIKSHSITSITKLDSIDIRWGPAGGGALTRKTILGGPTNQKKEKNFKKTPEAMERDAVLPRLLLRPLPLQPFWRAANILTPVVLEWKEKLFSKEPTAKEKAHTETRAKPSKTR